MRAVVLREYGAAGSSLRIEDDYPEPAAGPGQVLVRMAASSVNRIDVRLAGGYGRAALEALTELKPPIVLGRDVVGTVAAVGAGVDRFKKGDDVWGMILAFYQGAFADFAVAPEALLVKRPPSVPLHQAASLPYAGLTVWCALVKEGGIAPGTLAGKTALVLGGSAGTGSFAVQLLKAWGASVAATTSTRNVALVRDLGADLVIDYTKDDYARMLKGVDVVFDAVGDDEDKALGVMRRDGGAVFVTIVHPTMPITDAMGWADGIKHVRAMEKAKADEQRERFGRRYAWSLVRPDTAMVEGVAGLMVAGRVRMNIEAVVPIERIRDAFARVATERARGKIVVTIEG